LLEFVLGLIDQKYERVGGCRAASTALFIEKRYTGSGASGESIEGSRAELLQRLVYFLCGEEQALDAGEREREFIQGDFVRHG
jgi:hypothetical protein